jgi:hypothetical protein
MMRVQKTRVSITAAETTTTTARRVTADVRLLHVVLLENNNNNDEHLARRGAFVVCLFEPLLLLVVPPLLEVSSLVSCLDNFWVFLWIMFYFNTFEYILSMAYSFPPSRPPFNHQIISQ